MRNILELSFLCLSKRDIADENSFVICLERNRAVSGSLRTLRFPPVSSYARSRAPVRRDDPGLPEKSSDCGRRDEKSAEVSSSAIVL